MINKLEQKLDAEFDKIGIKQQCYHFGGDTAIYGLKPCIYHFTKDTFPFSAVTIATIGPYKSWEELWGILINILIRTLPPQESTKVLRKLQMENIYGVAICDTRDIFNRQRGRIIAKGRLLKHLKAQIIGGHWHSTEVEEK